MSEQEEIENFRTSLHIAGVHPREIDRAVLYAEYKGLETLDKNSCTIFAEPVCGDWNCINPDHQRFEDNE